MADRAAHRTTVGTPPPQATMGLLNYITATSLDEDYAHAQQVREQRGGGRQQRPGRSAIVVLAVFGVLVATAGVQTARNAGVEETSRDNLVDQVNSGREVLEESRDTLTALRTEVVRVQEANARASTTTQRAEQQVDRLGTLAGTVAVTGPGVRIRVDDAEGAVNEQQIVLDSDLRDIANGLWQAGAEAISINGYRLTTMSAIRVAGTLITVNYEKIVPPYTILAVGDRNRMPARFVESTTGTVWLNNKETFGLQFEMTPEDSVRVPAADPRWFRLRVAANKAEQVEGDS